MVDNALSLIQPWINTSTKKVKVIPRTDNFDLCDTVLGISEHSTLGTIVNHTGGLSLANGMIRHFGGNNQFNLSIKSVNQINNKLPTTVPGILIVADDVYGGIFGININTGIGKPGEMMYLPPDSYYLENMSMGHTAFLEWSLQGDIDLFFKQYSKLNIPRNIQFHKTLYFSPPLWVIDKKAKRSVSEIDSAKSHSIRAGIINELS